MSISTAHTDTRTDDRMHVDLHIHSTASDGSLAPADLMQLAHENAVEMLALTDHDTLAGLDEANHAAQQLGLHFIPGVELSVQWERKGLHLLGLNIDPSHRDMLQGIENLYTQRQHRAERIAKKLNALGVEGSLEGAQRYAGDGTLGRPHFARYLVEVGFVEDINDAFEKYLGRNKRAYVSTEWPELEDAIRWIRTAGGVAVLAHPLRYKLTKSWMRRLLKAFKGFGGAGIEVICGNYTPDEIITSVGYALRFDLQGSAGSDFHGHSTYAKQPGHLPALHSAITPVWTNFQR